MAESCYENFCLNGGSCEIADTFLPDAQGNTEFARCTCPKGFGGEHCGTGIELIASFTFHSFPKKLYLCFVYDRVYLFIIFTA